MALDVASAGVGFGLGLALFDAGRVVFRCMNFPRPAVLLKAVSSGTASELSLPSVSELSWAESCPR